MKNLFLAVFIFIMQTAAFAQEIFNLYQGPAPHSIPSAKAESPDQSQVAWKTQVINPNLSIYLPEKSINTGIGVVICPGGAYIGLAARHEGHDMAKRLQKEGIAGFVLEYRLPYTEFIDPKFKEFVPLMDAQRAIQILRENAQKWGLNSKKIGILGSSAGGHLAATAGTHFEKSIVSNPSGTNLRPDFLILNYPVISFADSITHHVSRYSLIGDLELGTYKEATKNSRQADAVVKALKVDAQKVAKYSNERNVRPNTPPTFISHALDDKVVPVQNALLFIAALQQNQVPVNSFFYTLGGHGYGMNNPKAEIEWIDACINWLKTLK
jgi:acetyl esterase/lipase